MGFFQWLRESGEPRLKCERVGHRIRRHWRSGLVPSQGIFRGVADRIRQERDFCERCRTPTSEWVETKRHSLTGLTAPQSTFDAIHAGGHFDDGGYVEPERDKS